MIIQLQSTFTLPILVSDQAPVNLLGRDALCKLKLQIWCTPQGVYVDKSGTHFQMSMQAQGTNVYENFESKDLGPMIKSSLKIKWNETGNPLIFYSSDKSMIKTLCNTSLTATPQEVTIITKTNDSDS